MASDRKLDEDGCLNIRWRRGAKVTYCEQQGQYRTVQYSTVQYSTVQYSTIKRNMGDKKGVGDVPCGAFS